MYQGDREDSGRHRLSLSVGNDQTRKELAQAAEIIQQNIRKFATPLTRIEIDDNPTSANRSYNFTLTVDKGGKSPFLSTIFPESGSPIPSMRAVFAV